MFALAMNQEAPIDAAQGRHGSPVAAIVILLLVLYLLPLLAVAIDEFVLRTFWFVRTFPDGSRSVFFKVYPFLHWFINS
jgi:hypothetical protein